MLRRLCLQWPRYGETATVPLAVADARPPDKERTDPDAGVGFQHAGRAPRRRYRDGRAAVGALPYQLPARPHHGARPRRTRAGRLRMRWRRQQKNSAECCRTYGTGNLHCLRPGLPNTTLPSPLASGQRSLFRPSDPLHVCSKKFIGREANGHRFLRGPGTAGGRRNRALA